MGLFSRFRLLGWRKDEKHILTGAEALSELGLTIMKLDTLDSRLEPIEKALEDLVEKTEEPREILNKIMKIVNAIIVPYLRAGSNPNTAKLLRHWYWIIDSWYRDIIRILDYKDIGEQQLKTYKKMILARIKEELFPMFKMLIAVSYRDEDIITNMVSVIQNVVYEQPTVNPNPSALSFMFETEAGKQ